MRNASDAMTSGNMNRRLGGMNGAATQSSNMRNASDAMAQGNMNRRLNATTGAGNLASNMRDSSFNEAYKRGQADDLRNQFNQQSKQQYDQFGVGLAMDKATGLLDGSTRVNGAVAGRAGQAANTGLIASGQTYGGQRDSVNLGRDIANDGFNRGLLGLQLQNQSDKDAQANAQLQAAIATVNQPAPKSWIDKGFDWFAG
jgi:hypothetical protein